MRHKLRHQILEKNLTILQPKRHPGTQNEHQVDRVDDHHVELVSAKFKLGNWTKLEADQ